MCWNLFVRYSRTVGHDDHAAHTGRVKHLTLQQEPACYLAQGSQLMPQNGQQTRRSLLLSFTVALGQLIERQLL